MRKRIYVVLLSLGILLHFAPATFSSGSESNFNQIDITNGIETEQPEIALAFLHIPNLENTNKVTAIRDVVRSYTATASWYKHGTRTANGERFNPQEFTVAHKNLPFGTMVRFTNPETGNAVLARVNDRGPYIRNREFDLSLRCAELLGMTERGVTRLFVEILQN